MNKTKQRQAPKGARKKQVKSQNKEVIANLKQALRISQDGMIAQTVVNGVRHFVMSEETLHASLKNAQATGRFEPNMPKELENFVQKHQDLMFLMNNMQYEMKERGQFESEEEYQKHVEIMTRNSEIFDELDYFTFEFSEAMRLTASDRKKVLTEFKQVMDKYPVLEKILSGRRQNVPVVGCVPCTPMDLEE